MVLQLAQIVCSRAGQPAVEQRTQQQMIPSIHELLRPPNSNSEKRQVCGEAGGYVLEQICAYTFT